MPVLTRWHIKAALLCLIAALAIGVALRWNALGSAPAVVATLAPVYFHLFMVGWVTQLIFGVAYWMFPKYSREKPRGSEALAWATFGLLNGGLILRAIGEPLHALQTNPVWAWALALSALLQWLAGLAFVINAWPRVKER
jgi:hypothetical protein